MENILSEELARLRLRGGYAVLAGFLLLLGVPLFQSLLLAPTGYLTAVNAIVAHQNFGPLLAWAAAHPSESRLFRVFEAVPFLLALGLPGPLCSLIWPGQHRARAVAAWVGRIGFALYALALFIGMFTSAAAASSYAGTQNANARTSIALDYAFRYAGETLISRVLGGVCIAIFLLLVSLRMVRTRQFPVWLAFLGIVSAALELATALIFALDPAQATTPTSGLALIALALWLIVTGILLVRMRALPNAPVNTPS
jgi:hypothetical protein